MVEWSYPEKPGQRKGKEMGIGTIIDGFKIVKAKGTPELIEKLAIEAVGIAGWTGSIGATAIQENTKNDITTFEGMVKVERVEA